MPDQQNDRRQFWSSVIERALVLILGLVAAYSWTKFFEASESYETKDRTHVQAQDSMKHTIQDLALLIADLRMENLECRKRIAECNRETKPATHGQRILDRLETMHFGSIDIGGWPELSGNNLSFGSGIYPLGNIHSICFPIVDGEGLVRIIPVQGDPYKHEVPPDFFLKRTVTLRGQTIQRFHVADIYCLVFRELE